MMLAAQALTATAAGGSERRENIGGRYAAQASPQQLAYLFGKVRMPAMSRHPGRWYTVRAGVAVELQLLFPGEDKDPDTQRWIADVVGTTECRTPSADQGETDTTTTDLSNPTTECRTPDKPLAALPATVSGPPIGLRDAVDTGLIPGTLPAARRRLQRAGSEGPKAVGIDANSEKLYDPTDLRQFFKGACS